MNKAHEKCLLKPDIFPINEKLVRLGFTKIRTLTVFSDIFEFAFSLVRVTPLEYLQTS